MDHDQEEDIALSRRKVLFIQKCRLVELSMIKFPRLAGISVSKVSVLNSAATTKKDSSIGKEAQSKRNRKAPICMSKKLLEDWEIPQEYKGTYLWGGKDSQPELEDEGVISGSALVCDYIALSVRAGPLQRKLIDGMRAPMRKDVSNCLGAIITVSEIRPEKNSLERVAIRYTEPLGGENLQSILIRNLDIKNLGWYDTKNVNRDLSVMRMLEELSADGGMPLAYLQAALRERFIARTKEFRTNKALGPAHSKIAHLFCSEVWDISIVHMGEASVNLNSVAELQRIRQMCEYIVVTSLKHSTAHCLQVAENMIRHSTMLGRPTEDVIREMPEDALSVRLKAILKVPTGNGIMCKGGIKMYQAGSHPIEVVSKDILIGESVRRVSYYKSLSPIIVEWESQKGIKVRARLEVSENRIDKMTISPEIASIYGAEQKKFLVLVLYSLGMTDAQRDGDAGWTIDTVLRSVAGNWDAHDEGYAKYFPEAVAITDEERLGGVSTSAGAGMPEESEEQKAMLKTGAVTRTKRKMRMSMSLKIDDHGPFVIENVSRPERAQYVMNIVGMFDLVNPHTGAEDRLREALLNRQIGRPVEFCSLAENEDNKARTDALHECVNLLLSFSVNLDHVQAALIYGVTPSGDDVIKFLMAIRRAAYGVTILGHLDPQYPLSEAKSQMPQSKLMLKHIGFLSQKLSSFLICCIVAQAQRDATGLPDNKMLEMGGARTGRLGIQMNGENYWLDALKLLVSINNEGRMALAGGLRDSQELTLLQESYVVVSRCSIGKTIMTIEEVLRSQPERASVFVNKQVCLVEKRKRPVGEEFEEAANVKRHTSENAHQSLIRAIKRRREAELESDGSSDDDNVDEYLDFDSDEDD